LPGPKFVPSIVNVVDVDEELRTTGAAAFADSIPNGAMVPSVSATAAVSVRKRSMNETPCTVLAAEML
jgi:hypothetical protein